MFDRQLAKWHLEREAYLAAIEVDLGGAGTVDVFGMLTAGAVARAAVFGVVRGWWHGGAYLTPSLIRNHLQTDRGLLDRAFDDKLLAVAQERFALTQPPEKVLFYSKRSPSLAAEAEAELTEMGIGVVYLEDILARALAEVNADDLGNATVFQVLAMVKSSNVFKEMARLARKAEREAAAEKSPETTKRQSVDRQQLNFLDLVLAQEDEGE